jgi:hypothetical protein
MDGRTTHQWILFNQVDAEHVTTYSHLNCSMTEWWWFQPRNESHISDDPQDIPRHPWAMTPWHDPFGSARRDASSSKPSIRRLLRRRVKPCPLGGLGKCLWNPLGILWEPLGNPLGYAFWSVHLPLSFWVVGQVADFLIAVAEPVSRPQIIHDTCSLKPLQPMGICRSYELCKSI